MYGPSGSRFRIESANDLLKNRFGGFYVRADLCDQLLGGRKFHLSTNPLNERKLDVFPVDVLVEIKDKTFDRSWSRSEGRIESQATDTRQLFGAQVKKGCVDAV